MSDDIDPDAAAEAMLAEIAGARVRRTRLACPARKCYLPNGHDDNVHGMQFPVTSSRKTRRARQRASRG